MADKKLTKVEKFNAILGYLPEVVEVDGVEFVTSEFIAHEIELIQKKGSSKSTKVNADDEPIKNAILEVLANNSQMTISEMINGSSALAGMSTQKVGPRVRSLENEGKVKNVSTKSDKKIYALV